jgi:hypothetical protein
VVKRLEKLDEKQVEASIEKVMHSFGDRHRNIEQIFSNHFRRIADQYEAVSNIFPNKKKYCLALFLQKNIRYSQPLYSIHRSFRILINTV